MESALREPMPVSAGADHIRHPYSGVWDSFSIPRSSAVLHSGLYSIAPPALSQTKQVSATGRRPYQETSKAFASKQSLDPLGGARQLTHSLG